MFQYLIFVYLPNINIINALAYMVHLQPLTHCTFCQILTDYIMLLGVFYMIASSHSMNYSGVYPSIYYE